MDWPRSVSSFSAFRDELFWIKTSVLFSIAHVNIRSLRRHWNMFQYVIKDVMDFFHVFVLTEINVPDEELNLYRLPGYEMFCYTRDRGRGGGIAVFVRREWFVRAVPVSCAAMECVMLNLTNNEVSGTLISIYRPPHFNVNNCIDELEHLLCLQCSLTCLQCF